MSVNRNRSASVVVALLLAAVAAVLPAGPALAHTELTATSPAARSTVRQPVTAVTLTFSGLVKKAGTTVIVTGPDGVVYSDGAAGQRDRTLTQKVRPLPVGAIKVAWRTVAGDGHPLKGSFTFTNRAAATPSSAPAPTSAAPSSPPPPSSAPAVVPAAGSGSGADEGGGSAVGWVIGLVAVAVLALLGGGLWWRRRSA